MGICEHRGGCSTIVLYCIMDWVFKGNLERFVKFLP